MYLYVVNTGQLKKSTYLTLKEDTLKCEYIHILRSEFDHSVTLIFTTCQRGVMDEIG